MNEEGKQAPQTPPEIPDMLQGLLSNPALLQKIVSTVGAMASISEAPSMPPKPQAFPTSKEANVPCENPSAPPALSTGIDGLSSFLSDPTMLEKLPQIMAVLKPLVASSASQDTGHPTSPQHDRDNLLLALKPFLSAERRDAVELILRLSKLGSVFQQLK